MRSIKSLVNRFRKIATKSTDLLFLIAVSDGYHGWKGIHIGSDNEWMNKFYGHSFVYDSK